MATYYRTIAYFMRAFIVIALLFFVLIPLSWWRNAERFPEHWWAAYVLGIPIVVVCWMASTAVLRMASRSK